MKTRTGRRKKTQNGKGASAELSADELREKLARTEAKNKELREKREQAIQLEQLA